MMKNYYKITKPGIVLGNLMTAVSGFTLASKEYFHLKHFNFLLLFETLLGLTLVIASACVFNNYIDRDSDKKMKRTQTRPLAQKQISQKSAIFFGCILAFIGFSTLALYTNLLTVLATFLGFFIYVVIYSLWKYRSFYATHVGSLSGATPPLIGYLSVSNSLDLGGLLLFLTVALWQMPHFFSIALFRKEDYSLASIPVMPIVKGVHTTKIHMCIYIVLFIVSASLLYFFKYTESIFLGGILLFGCIWLYLCMKGFKADNSHLWARNMFRFSLWVILLLSFMIIFDDISLLH